MKDKPSIRNERIFVRIKDVVYVVSCYYVETIFYFSRDAPMTPIHHSVMNASQLNPFTIHQALLRYSAWGRRYPFPGYLQRMRTVSGVPSDVKRFMSAMRI
ncbi:hypothetical protein HOY34_16815 [Xinfangfangia sp. D13-10-4-6]|nr:hypothetical protein [Pseudogemmobacter hezensis]